MFQSSLIDQLFKHGNVSFSAPTSAGKSFLLILYIAKMLFTNDRYRIVYIVPTKALINQVKGDLKKQLIEQKLEDVKILSSTVSFEFETFDDVDYEKCILILTQERFSYFLSKSEINFHLDLMIVDEAQNVSDGNRGVVLVENYNTSFTKIPKYQCRILLTTCFKSRFFF